MDTWQAEICCPSTAFPTDVVDLKTDHVTTPAAHRVELSRDLRVAIAEYAPGAEVVAAKNVWRGGGIFKQPNRDWPVYHYAICSECGRFHSGIEEIDATCAAVAPRCVAGATNMARSLFPNLAFWQTPSKANRARPDHNGRMLRESSLLHIATYAQWNRASCS